MKKYIASILATMCMATSLPAQDCYYYYADGKMPLAEHPTKVTVISPKAAGATLNVAVSASVANTIVGDENIIKVYEMPSAAAAHKAIAEASQPGVSVLPCYTMAGCPELVPDGYINVKLKTAEDLTALQAVADKMGCRVVGQNQFMPLWHSLCIIPAAGRNPVDMANAIYETGLFSSSSPSFAMDGLEISYDPDVHQQWGLYYAQNENYDINASRAWNYATGRGVVVAIIDDGVDVDHKDLAANIHPLSYDTETNSSPSKLYGSHGTHCAGIVAAVRNNGIQITGVAPDAKIMSISVVPKIEYSNNKPEKYANAINWAWKNGADILSCSWQCSDQPIVREAIDSAITRGRNCKGCIIVKSAGNREFNINGAPIDSITFPGNYRKEILAVARLNSYGGPEQSSQGWNMFIAAPGTDILSTMPGNEIGLESGTSMAAPHVSGVAALMLERNPDLTAAEVREIMARNANKSCVHPFTTEKIYGTWSSECGYGIVDAYASVINTPINNTK